MPNHLPHGSSQQQSAVAPQRLKSCLSRPFMMASTPLHSPLKSRSNFPIRRGRTDIPRRGWVLSACAIFPLSPVSELSGNWERRGGVQFSGCKNKKKKKKRTDIIKCGREQASHVSGSVPAAAEAPSAGPRGRGCSLGHVQKGASL